MSVFKFVDFNNNILKSVALENSQSETLFLCPNHASLKQLKLHYQQLATFNCSEFSTLDNFKLKCLEIDTPILKEERRTLAFYAALKPEYRKKFHLSNYFQSVSLAYDFFTFFDELTEEIVDLERVQAVFGETESAENWQSETFKILLAIRGNYYKYITARNFTDLIFLKKAENINNLWLNKFQNIVVVNQFYFTSLEKLLLPEDNTVIYLQMPENIYDKVNMCCRAEFNSQHLENLCTRIIHNHILTDEFSLKHYLFHQLNSKKPDVIVDFGLLQQHVDNYECRHQLDCGNSYKFCNSSIFQFYEQVHELLSAIIPNQDDYLISLNSIIAAFNNHFFATPFLAWCFTEFEPSQIEPVYEKLQKFIYTIIDNNYKYISLRYIIPEYKIEPSVNRIFGKLKMLLDNFSNISSLSELISIFTSSYCLLPAEIIIPYERQFTDLEDTFFNLTEDLSSLDTINLLNDWKCIFTIEHPSCYYAGSEFLRLFLEYAKSKTFHFYFDKPAPDRIQLTSLHNTRNLQYSNVVIVDTIEGVIPPARQTPFLLTEAQRRKLGLKTFEDIILREKYYLFRLIAQADTVHCFSRTSPSDRTEISSFLEELQIFFPSLFSQDVKPHTTLFSEHCQNWLPAGSISLDHPKLPEDFFSLPFRRQNDLKNDCFIVKPSNFQKIIEHPFNYYLQDMLNIKDRQIEIEMDYSPLQIGSLVHEAFADIWQRLLKLYQNNPVHHPFNFNQENYAERALSHHLIHNPAVVLQKPHNYSDSYFKKVICPMIIDALTSFLQSCDEKYTNIPIRIIPEKGRENRERQLFVLDNIPVILKGRADLRIEVLPTSEKHIYDYKSGKHKAYYHDIYYTQLIMYEILYYEHEPLTRSWLYFVTDQELLESNLKKISHAEFFSNKISDLQESLQKVFKTGYFIGNKADPYEDDDLTRRLLNKLSRSTK